MRGFENNEGEDMNYSGLKICEGKCRKPFRPVFEGQTVCSQCQISPHKKPVFLLPNEIVVNPIKPQEANMPEEKICVEPDCQKKYVPTGNCQKRCPECQAKKKYKKRDKANEAQWPKKVIKQSVKAKPQIVNRLKMPEAVYLKTDSSKLFEAALTMCELSGSVTVQAAGMEITFKKI